MLSAGVLSLERYKLREQGCAHETAAAVDTQQVEAQQTRSATRNHGHVLDPSAGGARRRAPELERLALVQTRSDAHRRPDRRALYSFETHRQPPPLVYDPIRCNGCGALLNPYCQLDFRTKLWTCPFCLGRNHFPPHYAENITETNLPAELIPQFTTVEYELQQRSVGPPVFLFVVDTCLPESELESLKDSIQQTLNLLPEDALVGLITFGAHVLVHEIGSASATRP